MTNELLLLTESVYFNSMLYSLEFLAGVPTLIILLYTFVKCIKQFLDFGDMRFVFLSQVYAYLFLVVSESIVYMIFGCANDFCIISFKIFVLVCSFSYAQTKFTGHIMLKVPRLIRGTLYTSILTFFWLVALFFATTTESTFIFETDLTPFEKFDQIVFFMGLNMNGSSSQTQFVLSSIAPLVFITLCIMVDLIERKPAKMIINGFCMFIPAIINILLIELDNDVLTVFLLLTMVMIQAAVLIRECYIIAYIDDSTVSEKLAEKLLSDLKRERNINTITMKKKMIMRTFSEEDARSFKSKKLQNSLTAILQSTSVI